MRIRTASGISLGVGKIEEVKGGGRIGYMRKLMLIKHERLRGKRTVSVFSLVVIVLRFGDGSSSRSVSPLFSSSSLVVALLRFYGLVSNLN
jgi:hypothetical protein